jgi:Flp pilus assembly secretin CpaC
MPDQVLDMLRRLIESGKGRTANKLRSYLLAAYQCALDVRTLAAIPVVFKTFGVVFNPAAQTNYRLQLALHPHVSDPWPSGSFNSATCSA